MNLKRLLMTSGLSALAAAMAMTSLPSAAAAAERPDRDESPERAEQRDNRGSVVRQNRADRRESRSEARAERQAQLPQQSQARQQQPVRAEAAQQRTVTRDITRTVERDHRRADTNRGNRPAIVNQAIENSQANNRRGEAVQRQREQERIGQRDGRDQRTSTDRNRSYTDQNRNGSYSNRDRESARDQRSDYRSDRRDARNDRSDYRDHRRWDRNSWRNNTRYNWYGYRASNRNIYRLGHYYAPYRNYNYSRVNIGFRLGSLFFGSRYWINDPWQYRLPEAYGNYRWVRYYDDALLVDVYSGQVVDVIHDFFW